MSNVIFYSGIKKDETPKKIIKNGKTVDVFLTEEKLIEDILTRKRERVFIVTDKKGNKYKIRGKNERYFVDSW